MIDIAQTVVAAWTQRRTRTTPSGWISANAVCCHHRGHRPDQKGRGGVIADGSSVSYSCFNCGHTAHWQSGRPLSYKMRKLLLWMGLDDGTVRRLALAALGTVPVADSPTVEPTAQPQFLERELPQGSRSLYEWAQHWTQTQQTPPDQFLDAVSYVADRGIDLDRYGFAWCESSDKLYNRRVIVPYTHQQQLVGHTARAIYSHIQPRYLTDSQPGYVFNVDRQLDNWAVVVVTEGPFDAMSIDGVAVMHNELNELQVNTIEQLKRPVIVVPDWDRAGRQLVDQALEYQWNVSFPLWRSRYKDINSAVCDLGKLFVLKTILDSAEHSNLKIQLMTKKTQWSQA
jgi:hypothetical protein